MSRLIIFLIALGAVGCGEPAPTQEELSQSIQDISSKIDTALQVAFNCGIQASICRTAARNGCDQMYEGEKTYWDFCTDNPCRNLPELQFDVMAAPCIRPAD